MGVSPGARTTRLTTSSLPVVAVSIAATIGHEVVAGAVADVLRGELFTARLGGGARRDGNPITTGKPFDLAQSLIGTGFSYESDLRAFQAEILRSLLPASRDVRCMGSAALNMCWVGCGRLDGYYEQHTQIYDYAAGGLIAAEAGATVELPGANRIGLAISAAPSIFADLRSIVRTAAGG
jgi:myo-inositol-1(or 4)-monophosphatase